MRISRLHVLLILVATGVVGYVAYKQKEMAESQTTFTKPSPLPGRQAGPSAPVGGPAVDLPARRQASPPASAPAPAASPAIDHYTVSKGDTLWAIARDHSPAQAGAAWVGIWKANKKLIKDFDNLEDGIELLIPQTRQAYVTMFWKPKRFQLARERQDVDLAEVFQHVPTVDVAELPVPWSDLEVDVAELPLPEGTAELEFAVTAFRSPVPPLIPYR